MLSLGQIVRSKSGRDANRFMIVVGFSGDMVLVADGKERPLEKPKRKNYKHIAITQTVLEKELYKTNRSLRHALMNYECKNIEKGV